MSDSSNNLLNERQAAEYLGRRPGTLRGWRYDGTGPEYVIADGYRVRYYRAALDAFKASRKTRVVRPGGAK
jgi:hypothetical protein